MMSAMTDSNRPQTATQQIAAPLERGDIAGMRVALIELLARPGGAASLQTLDAAGLLTRIIPELEPARHTDQPLVHFLPVLAHSLETVAAAEWLLVQLEAAPAPANDPASAALPAALQIYPDLRYDSVYLSELRAHFAGAVGRYPRVALFKLAALLHDIAKPQTKQPKPGGGVSFHDHQTIGGEVALVIARRLGFDKAEAGYIRTVVREHMRPGQLAAQGEITLRAVHRFFHSIGDAAADVLLFLLADHMATRGPLLDTASWQAQVAWIDAMLDTVWGEEEASTPPLINGDDLMIELGIAPGPLLGRLLAAVGEAQAGGDITTRDEALDLARRHLRQTRAT
jgi:poly(A) polymerase/tRNA nucleotidyltransferase (CCA-adding enzyme)